MPGIAGQQRNALKLVLYRQAMDLDAKEEGSHGYRGYFAHDSRTG